MQNTYTIPYENLAKMEQRLARLKKAADKVDAPLGWTVGPARTVEKPDGPGRVKVYTVHDVEVIGTTPRLNGWAFVATLQHTGDGVILRTVPGQVLGAFYTERENAGTLALCDYCLTVRNRKDTYVVRHENMDERVVGSSCLRDFLGHRDPHAVAKYAEALGAFNDFAGGLGGEGIRGDVAVDIEAFLAHAAADIRLRGYFVSRARSEDTGETTTRASAWFNITEDLPRGKGYRPEPVDFEQAREALAWVEGLEPDAQDEYLHNLTVACASSYVTYRTAGIVASALPAYRRAMRASAPAPAAPAGAWVGAVGEKGEFHVKVVALRSIQSQFGEKTLAVFEDAAGNTLKTFTQSKTLGLVEGEWVAIKATVKAHEEFRGRRETMLLRPRIAA